MMELKKMKTSRQVQSKIPVEKRPFKVKIFYSTLFEVYFKDDNNCMCIKNTFLVPKRLNIKTRGIL